MTTQVRVGTNLEKAPTLQFGGMTTPTTIRRTGGVIKIGSHPVPPRPFVMFQPQDINDIEKLGFKHLEKASR